MSCGLPEEFKVTISANLGLEPRGPCLLRSFLHGGLRLADCGTSASSSSTRPPQPLPRFEFVDPEPQAGKSHRYRVIALNTAGGESVPSAEASAP